MKKLLLNSLRFALIFMIALSCTKIGKNITVKGRVLNPITGVGISGVEIKLLRSQNLQYNGGYKAIKKVVSDENGNYEINATRLGPIYLIPGEIGQNYSLGFSYEGQYYSMKKVDKGKVMHIDYHLVPYGKLQINIKNTNCFDQNDQLRIFRSHSIPGFYDNVPNPAIYTGCVDQQGNLNQAPMGWYKYNGTITKNGVETTIRDSIYLDAETTRIWNIYY